MQNLERFFEELQGGTMSNSKTERKQQPRVMSPIPSEGVTYQGQEEVGFVPLFDPDRNAQENAEHEERKRQIKEIYANRKKKKESPGTDLAVPGDNGQPPAPVDAGDAEDESVPVWNSVAAVMANFVTRGKNLSPRVVHLMTSEDALPGGDMPMEELGDIIQEMFRFSSTVDATSIVLAKRRGEALWWMRQGFRTRREEIRRLGLKLRDEKLTWTGWLALKKLPRNSVGRAIKIHLRWPSVKELAEQQLGDLYGEEALGNYQEYLEDVPTVGTIVKAQDAGMEVNIREGEDQTKKVMLDQGTCFEVVPTPEGESDQVNPWLKIRNGPHHGKVILMRLVKFKTLPEITEGDIGTIQKPPKAAPKKPAKPDIINGLPKAPPEAKTKVREDGSATYLTKKEVACGESLMLPKDTYLGLPKKGSGVWTFMVLTGEHAEKQVTLTNKDCQQLGVSGWGILAERFLKDKKVPPWGRPELHAVLQALLAVREARAKMGKLDDMETDFIRAYALNLSTSHGW
jgi:hypothetical protein